MSASTFMPEPAETGQAQCNSGPGQGLPVTQGCEEEIRTAQKVIPEPEESEAPKQAKDAPDVCPVFFNQELQHWINVGAVLCSLGEQNDLDSVPGVFWEQHKSVADETTASDLVYALSLLPVESIETALSGIRILSYYRYGGTSSPGVLPILYTEVLIQYFNHIHANRNYVDCSIAMYTVIMKQCGYGADKIANSMGVGDKKIYAAIEALKKDGLVMSTDHINAPGAGRDDIDAAFGFSITPDVIAAKITEKQIQLRKFMKDLEEVAINGASSPKKASDQADSPGEKPESATGDEKEHRNVSGASLEGTTHSGLKEHVEGGPGSDHQEADGGVQKQTPAEGGASGQSKETHYKPCKTQEIDLRKLKEKALDDVNKAMPIIAFSLDGKEMHWTLWDLMKRLEKDRQTVEDYYSLICPKDGNKAGSDVIAFNLTPSFVEFCDELRKCCNAIIQVKEKNEAAFDKKNYDDPLKASYWVSKLLRKVVEPKRFLQNLADEEYRYTRICNILEEAQNYIDAAEIAEQEGDSGPESDAERENRYEEDRSKALIALETVIEKMEEALGQANKGTKFYEKAEETVKFLRTLREDFLRAAKPELSDNPDISILQEVMVSMLKLHMGDVLELWPTNKKLDALKKAVGYFNQEKFNRWIVHTFTYYDKVFQAYQKSQELSGSEAEGQEAKEQAEVSRLADEATRMANEEALQLALTAIEGAITSYRTLISLLTLASSRQVRRKNSAPNPIPEAIAYLDGMFDILAKLKMKAINSLSGSVRKALEEMAHSLCDKTDVWIEALNNDGRYTQAKLVANSINKKSYHDFCEKQAEMALDDSKNKGWDADVLGHYKAVFADDPMGLHSPEGSTISPSERRKIILELWRNGLDPTSVKAWLQYITERNSKEIFGDPMGNVSCCKLTPDELSNSFRYLTGYKISGRALWDYLIKRMGFTRHQCQKEEQIGEDHPQRDAQYTYIDSQRAEAISNSKILILSIDTKAVVKIGRFKHDNGLLLCSPDGKVYRVHDHDFLLKWRQIYGEDNCPIGKDRLDEKAIVHPCAVYDVLANTCHISFVLGTENSESMANILIKAITDKLEERPDIESVLILADGGGVNSSNSYFWKNELLRVSEATKLKLQISHYPPGCSRHNPVERCVFAPLSRAWKGKSLHNLEVLAKHTCNATTKSSKTGHPLKIYAFIDLLRYKTLKQKKADNDTILTREEFEKNATGRIFHNFSEEEGALHKWNYYILPPSHVIKEAS